ncbi:hypothetical protein OXPF_18630 [Oxobacter pfennigii]|uniref:Lipoprotein n=1 Tax=Oxobacter pfennigii TaxID=36849 RepID=A0A0P8X1T7_9CLOT|nr:hypothetical protein [Oxobacter pfennigii]KPU44777.1 hypothetical protein OXPF_18630 [Oxobacter pfennigii]
MIKTALITGIIMMLFMISGCSGNLNPRISQPGTDIQNNGNVDENKNPTPAVVRPRSLGGICLGDSIEDVVKILGKDYKESLETDDSGYFKEDLTVWTYDKGITVKFGKETEKVISVTSFSPDFETDLGVRVEDSAKTGFEKYKPKSDQVTSRHTGEPLEGWFDIGEEKLIILDFDKGNNTKVNSIVEDSSIIEEIVLAYWDHFD